MSIMKRDLLITVECGKDTCQDCDYRNRRAEACDMWQLSLDDEGHRLKECIAAEEKMLDLIIRQSVAHGAA